MQNVFVFCYFCRPGVALETFINIWVYIGHSDVSFPELQAWQQTPTARNAGPKQSANLYSGPGCDMDCTESDPSASTGCCWIRFPFSHALLSEDWKLWRR